MFIGIITLVSAWLISAIVILFYATFYADQKEAKRLSFVVFIPVWNTWEVAKILWRSLVRPVDRHTTKKMKIRKNERK